MVGKGSNNNTWMERKACCKEKSKDLPTTAHWAELFNSNSKGDFKSIRTTEISSGLKEKEQC